MNSNIYWLSLTPRLTVTEDWLWQSRDYTQYNDNDIYSYDYTNPSDFNRRLTWNASVNLHITINFKNLKNLMGKL